MPKLKLHWQILIAIVLAGIIGYVSKLAPFQIKIVPLQILLLFRMNKIKA